MTPNRKPPHCRTCHKPLKGHRRGICDNDPPSPAVVSPGRSVREKTQKSAPPPLERIPTLSTESSQLLNDMLRANSHTAPPLQVPRFTRLGLRRSGRGTKNDESLGETVDAAKAEVEKQKHCENIITLSQYHEARAMPGAWEPILQIQNHSTTLPPPSSSIATQNLVKPSSKDSSVDPLTIIISQQLKLENSTPDGPYDCQQHPSAPDVPSAYLTIRNFLNSMARNPQHPPATIFSYPIEGMTSLENNVKHHGLCMHILSLSNSKEEWSPVVIGRDQNAITKLLEDGEKLAQGLHRPDRFKIHELDLGISHLVVGALGALATWVGLAYS